MKRRAYLAAVAGGAVALPGCVGLPGLGPSTPTPSDGPLVRSGAGDYRHDIDVDNSLQRSVTLTITVERDGSRLYRESHTVDAGVDRTVAGIARESLPEGSRRLTITATSADGESTGVDVTVTDCLGHVVVYFDSAGDLQSTYSIC